MQEVNIIIKLHTRQKIIVAYKQFENSNLYKLSKLSSYEGWNFNSGNYLFTTDII